MATSKIDTTQLDSDLTPNGFDYALNIMLRYGEYGRQFKFARNCTASAPGTNPTGFQVTVLAGSPVWSETFSRTHMFNGTLAFPLDAGEASALVGTGGRAKTEYFLDSRNRVAERIKECLDSLGSGDETNFAGVFSQHGTRRGDSRFWIVVQAHSDALSRRAFEMIEAAEPDSLRDVDQKSRFMVERHNQVVAARDSGDQTKVRLAKEFSQADSEYTWNEFTSWDELFIRSPEMMNMAPNQREVRGNIMLRMMQALGLGAPKQNPETRKELLYAVLDSEHTVDQTFNCVDVAGSSGRTQCLAYFDKLSFRRAIRPAGALVCEFPTVGCSVLRGPWKESAMPIGDGIVDASAGMFQFLGVPVCTGMARSNAYLAAEAFRLGAVTRASLLSDVASTFSFVDGTDMTLRSALFTVNNVRKRSSSWEAYETQCGFDRARGVIQLEPVRVCYASPNFEQAAPLFDINDY